MEEDTIISSWYYLDDEEEEHGPFPAAQMLEWHRAQPFPGDMQLQPATLPGVEETELIHRTLDECWPGEGNPGAFEEAPAVDFLLDKEKWGDEEWGQEEWGDDKPWGEEEWGEEKEKEKEKLNNVNHSACPNHESHPSKRRAQCTHTLPAVVLTTRSATMAWLSRERANN